MFGNVNYLAVLVAAISAMVVGFIWYSESFFGKIWIELNHITEKDNIGSSMGKNYSIMFMSSVVMAVVLAWLINLSNSSTLLDGMILAFWMWLGFVVTTFLSEVLFAKKPWKMFFIQSGYYLATLMVMGAILAIWR